MKLQNNHGNAWKSRKSINKWILFIITTSILDWKEARRVRIKDLLAEGEEDHVACSCSRKIQLLSCNWRNVSTGRCSSSSLLPEPIIRISVRSSAGCCLCPLSALWPRDQRFSGATESKPFIELIQVGDGEERDESNALVLLNEWKDARFFKRIIDLSILLLVRHSRTCLLLSLFSPCLPHSSL